jgi:uncharacterized coiled-coil DUF342 family protein
MTYNDTNKEKITQIENLIQDTKSSLKSWANQISKYHKILKELTNKLEAIKKEITMNQPNKKLKSNSK